MAHPTLDQHKAPATLVGRGPRTPGFPSPDQIRMSIQQLVTSDEIDEAKQLADEGLEVYPDNEGVLAISGLLAMVRNDWVNAEGLLRRLLEVQGDRASDYTRMMYERAQQCCNELLRTPGIEP